MKELAELRGRVMELQTKDSHTPQELAELDMLRGRVLDFQVFFQPPPVSGSLGLPAAYRAVIAVCSDARHP